MASVSVFDKTYQISNLNCVTDIKNAGKTDFVAKIDSATKLNPKRISLRSSKVAKIYIQKI